MILLWLPLTIHFQPLLMLQLTRIRESKRAPAAAPAPTPQPAGKPKYVSMHSIVPLRSIAHALRFAGASKAATNQTATDYFRGALFVCVDDGTNARATTLWCWWLCVTHVCVQGEAMAALANPHVHVRAVKSLHLGDTLMDVCKRSLPALQTEHNTPCACPRRSTRAP